MVLFISVREEGKWEKNYKKREKNFSELFLVTSLPEKMIRKSFGGKEKE